MALPSWPNDVFLKGEVPCAICGALQSIEKMTAGSEDRHDAQQFACDVHTSRPSEFILGWADYLAADEEDGLRNPDDRVLEPAETVPGIYVEERVPTHSTSTDVARHLYSRSMCLQPTFIISEYPAAWFSALRKQWANTLRQVSIEQSRTLQPARIRQLYRLRARMETMRFRLNDALDSLDADVRLVKPKELKRGMQGTFHTAYALEPLSASQLSALSKFADSHALLVMYKYCGPIGE